MLDESVDEGGKRSEAGAGLKCVSDAWHAKASN